MCKKICAFAGHADLTQDEKNLIKSKLKNEIIKLIIIKETIIEFTTNKTLFKVVFSFSIIWKIKIMGQETKNKIKPTSGTKNPNIAHPTLPFS